MQAKNLRETVKIWDKSMKNEELSSFSITSIAYNSQLPFLFNTVKLTQIDHRRMPRIDTLNFTLYKLV